jgi:endogenous inhibitor of DNA gyrase (YacG/DUF329 family)
MHRCPNCQKPVKEDAESRPFCSARCKDVDLGRWLGEEYRISRPMTPLEMESMARALASGDGSLRDEVEDDFE